MKMLLSTTALVVALGLPTLTLAQTTPPAANPETQAQNTEMSGFMAARGQSDLYASDLMGQDVYARRTTAGTTETNDAATTAADGTADMASMNRADLDEMDNIGQITEIVMSNDGQVRALVIGVGGFLGMGDQDVAVTMDQVSFASDADDPSQTYIIVNTGGEMLKTAPAYDRTAAWNEASEGNAATIAGSAQDTAATMPESTEGTAATIPESTEGSDQALATDRAAFAAPLMEREGYAKVEVTEVSADLLMGKSVYDTNDNDVGSVADMIIDDAGKVTDVIVDFGGFLGIGSSQASIGFDELTILSTEGYEDVRVYVDATKAQIQELPQYQASN